MDPFSAMALIGGVVSAVGQYSAGQYQADQAEKRAEIGRIRATQIDTAHREDLQGTIANIRSIRAATGVGANSPTTLALEGENTKIADRNRTRDVANQKMQANQDQADAKFYRRSAGLSLGVGLMKAGLNLKE